MHRLFFYTMRLQTTSLFSLGLFLPLCLLLVSCNKNTPAGITYDVTDATVANFYFAANDSFPGLAKAVFIVDDRVDTGLIHMQDKDSMQFGTSLEKVVPRLIFNSVPAAAIYYTGDTSMVMTGYDTLNFTRTPLYVRVYANDRKHEKWYRIEPRVHQIDPFVYRWTTLSSGIPSALPAEQQGFLLNDQVYFFRNEDARTMLYRYAPSSATPVTPLSAEVSGLPADCHVQRLVWDETSQRFCYGDSLGFYTSEDGISFSATEYPTFVPSDYTLRTLLMAFDGNVWAVVQDASSRSYLAYGAVSALPMQILCELTADFPLSDFAVSIFVGAGNREHALIAGGYNAQGRMLNTIWSFESYNDSYRMVNVAGPEMTPFAGAAVVWYGNRLLTFGGTDKYGNLLESVRYSESEGMHWLEADSTWHILPAAFGARKRISVLTDGEYLYLLGGQSATHCFTDLYQGRLNSINW